MHNNTFFFFCFFLVGMHILRWHMIHFRIQRHKRTNTYTHTNTRYSNRINSLAPTHEIALTGVKSISGFAIFLSAAQTQTRWEMHANSVVVYENCIFLTEKIANIFPYTYASKYINVGIYVLSKYMYFCNVRLCLYS